MSDKPQPTVYGMLHRVRTLPSVRQALRRTPRSYMMTTVEPTTVADELAAMRRIVATLDKLDPPAQERVVGWMWDRYRHPVEEERLS